MVFNKRFETDFGSDFPRVEPCVFVSGLYQPEVTGDARRKTSFRRKVRRHNADVASDALGVVP